MTGNYVVTKCKATGNGGYSGMLFTQGAEVDCFSCSSNGNQRHGFGVHSNSRGYFTSCVARQNVEYGISLDANSNANLYTTVDYSNNALGIGLARLCYIGFGAPLSGTITNNMAYALDVGYNSIAAGTNRPAVDMVTGNGLGSTHAALGGAIYP